MQPDLLDWVPQRFRNTDPDTSVEAGTRIRPSLAELQSLVLAWLEKQPDGATDEELSDAFECKGSTYRTRRSELVALGKVRDSGKREILLTGRKAIVWEVVK